jgi:hypothetical protein
MVEQPFHKTSAAYHDAGFIFCSTVNKKMGADRMDLFIPGMHRLLLEFMQYSAEIQEAYLQAKTLPTPADNDHIRFSWLVYNSGITGLRCMFFEKKKIIRYVLERLFFFL